MYKLQTVREYAIEQGISETAVHKRIKNNSIKSCQLNDLTYIAVEDGSHQVIKDLRAKIKLLNSNIRTLKEKVSTVTDQKDEIIYLRERVKKLEDDLSAMYKDYKASTDTKEELYEKVINTLMLPSK